MKILIITQSLDTQHVILGFFHRWIEEFAKNCEQVTVICLEEGSHNLPKNVKVLSLGKEKGESKIKYVFRFYKYIWQQRKNYDSVFVHMNQIYVILGALLWRVKGKKIGLWYTHGSTSTSLKVASFFTNKIFTASAGSFKLISKKTEVIGHGIDTDKFSPNKNLDKIHDLVTVGRITPVKNLLELIDIVEDLQVTHQVELSIVGSAVTKIEKEHEQELKEIIINKKLQNKVNFLGKVSQEDLPLLLQQSKIFVTVAKNGSLDKAMLEPLACGLPVVSMSEGSESLPLGTAQVDSRMEFDLEVKNILDSGKFYKQDYTDYVAQNHSLRKLIPKIIRSIS